MVVLVNTNVTGWTVVSCFFSNHLAECTVTSDILCNGLDYARRNNLLGLLNKIYVSIGCWPRICEYARVTENN